MLLFKASFVVRQPFNAVVNLITFIHFVGTPGKIYELNTEEPREKFYLDQFLPKVNPFSVPLQTFI